MDICTIESVSYELIAVVAFGFHKRRLYVSGNGCKGVRIYVQGSIFFIVYAFFFIYDVFIKTYSCLFCVGSFYPVNCTFYFTSVRSVTAFGSRIVSTVYNTYSAVIICFITGTGNKVCVHQTNFCTEEQSLVFTRRVDHEIVAFDIKFTTEWNLTGSESFVFHVVRSIQIFYLSFWIIVDHKFDRIHDSHHTRTF